MTDILMRNSFLVTVEKMGLVGRVVKAIDSKSIGFARVGSNPASDVGFFLHFFTIFKN